MELDSVFEEVVARGLINDEQPSLVGYCHQKCHQNLLSEISFSGNTDTGFRTIIAS